MPKTCKHIPKARSTTVSIAQDGLALVIDSRLGSPPGLREKLMQDKRNDSPKVCSHDRDKKSEKSDKEAPIPLRQAETRTRNFSLSPINPTTNIDGIVLRGFLNKSSAHSIFREVGSWKEDKLSENSEAVNLKTERLA